MKTPFEFTFKAMANFASLSGSNYHTIKVKYDSFYSVPTLSQRSNDLFYYIPTCHLNGDRIEDCTISGGKIIMRFQQQISSGQ